MSEHVKYIRHLKEEPCVHWVTLGGALQTNNHQNSKEETNLQSSPVTFCSMLSGCNYVRTLLRDLMQVLV